MKGQEPRNSKVPVCTVPAAFRDLQLGQANLALSFLSQTKEGNMISHMVYIVLGGGGRRVSTGKEKLTGRNSFAHGTFREHCVFSRDQTKSQ